MEFRIEYQNSISYSVFHTFHILYGVGTISCDSVNRIEIPSLPYQVILFDEE